MAVMPEEIVSATDDNAYKFYGGSAAPLFKPGSGDTEINVGYSSSAGNKSSAGIIFRTVPIPQGSVILSATLELFSRSNRSNTAVNTKIRAYAADDYAGDFSTEAEWDAIFPANVTVATVLWDNIPAWTLDVQNTSPDISAVVQEVISRPGWASGTLVIFWDDFDGRSTASNDTVRQAWNYRGSVINKGDDQFAPRLNVSYASGGQVMHIQRG